MALISKEELFIVLEKKSQYNVQFLLCYDDIKIWSL